MIFSVQDFLIAGFLSRLRYHHCRSRDGALLMFTLGFAPQWHQIMMDVSETSLLIFIQ